MPDTLSPDTLKALVDLRIAEAQTLLAAGLFDGACYLCGYVIELALKAAVCKTLNLKEYPVNKLKGTFKTHSPDELLLLSGLQSLYDTEASANPDFAANWGLVTGLGPDERYSFRKTRADAEEVLKAVTATPDGVLLWLTRQW